MSKIVDKLSIIIPCYNCEKTLEKALDSIYTQNHPDFEIIMVDDGSTDETRTLMNKLADNHKEIRLIFHDKNRGGGAARNTGIKNSNGSLIFCLDSDNLLAPNTLGKMAKFLRDKNADGVGFYERRFFHDNNLEQYKVRLNPITDKPFSFADLFNSTKLFLDNFLYTKESYLKTNGYPEHHGFDTQSFEIHYLAMNQKVYICPDTIFYHRQAQKNKSYFERVYESGAMSKNYYFIFEDILPIFSKEVLTEILSFDILNKTSLYDENLKTHMDNLCMQKPDNFSQKINSTHIKNILNDFSLNNKNSQDVGDIFIFAIQSIKNHNYGEAKKYFDKLLAAGFDGPIIFYNLLRIKIGLKNKELDEINIIKKTDEMSGPLTPKKQNPLYNQSFFRKLFIKFSKVYHQFIVKNFVRAINVFIRIKTACTTSAYHFFGQQERKEFQKNYYYYREKFNKFNETHTKEEYSFATIPVWQDFLDKVTGYFKNEFKINFLTNQFLANTMFISYGGMWQKIQLEFLKKNFSKKILGKILKENHIGNPKITSTTYLTSHNSIHHLYHLAFFKKITQIDYNNIKSVVEWGGGYGNMAKIFLRINPDTTYTIIDLPVFSFIQATYLSTIYGRDKINLITKQEDRVKKNLINIIPLNKLVVENISYGDTDLFISTWALSESSDTAQQLVEKMNYFNSKNLLMAHQSSSEHIPFANNLKNYMKNYSVILHKKISFIKGNSYYLFARKK